MVPIVATHVVKRSGRTGSQWRLTCLTLSLLSLLSACGDSDRGRGDAVALTEVATLTKAAVDQSTTAAGVQPLTGPALCDVSVKQLVYRTVAPDGADIEASAALLMPGGAGCTGPFPLVAYTKGTDFMLSFHFLAKK